MGVSANTLFHFTNKDSLQSILQSLSFKPSYSLERFSNVIPKESFYSKAYIPMVCFCDLPITQLSRDSRHTKDFGRFGIGLKKEWGIANEASPVVYIHENSTTPGNITKLITNLGRIKKSNDHNLFFKEIKSDLLDFIKYLKPYDGYYQKGKRHKSKITYYNEREWRFCPKKEVGKYSVMSGKLLENKAAALRLSKDLRTNNLLKFKSSDIKYIILNNSDDIAVFTNVINDMPIYENEKHELQTKIITFKEIEDDF